VSSLGCSAAERTTHVHCEPKMQHRGYNLTQWNALSLPKNIRGVVL
jgi:hypothetical protein